VESNAFDFRADLKPNCGTGCSVVGSSYQGSYSTEVIAARAVEVIEAHDSAAAPLFAYVAFQGVHSPAQVPARFEDLNVDIAYSIRRKFAGMVSAMDEGVANITAALSAAGMLDNTILIVTSDNGGPIDKTEGGDAIGASNFPFRGGKHSLWEGGIHAIGFIWGGAGTALRASVGYASSRYSVMFDATDWLPTLLDAAGAGGGASPNGLALDGVSHWPGLLNRTVDPARNATFVNHWDNPLGGDGMRLDEGDRSWKLIRGNVAFVGGDNTPNWFAAENCEVDVANPPPGDYPCCCAAGTDPPYDAAAWAAKSAGRNATALPSSSSSSSSSSSCSSDSGKLDGVCRPHNDIIFGGSPAASWESCCGLCAETESCVAWTYHEGNPSPCFLKNATDGGTTSDPACTSSPEAAPQGDDSAGGDDHGGGGGGGDDDDDGGGGGGGGSCASEATDALAGTCRPGNDLVPGGVAAGDWQACCGLCGSTPGCAAWTYNSAAPDPGTPCFLKSGDTAGAGGATCVSSPEPAATVLLFDVRLDPGETTDLAAAYSDVVARMLATMDALLETAAPEGPPIDAACGPYKWASDPVVGDTWAPWC